MTNKIFPCLWCNGDASLAAQFYTRLFGGTVTQNSFSVVTIELFRQKMMFLNAGPQFEKNASVSFMVLCETEEEVNRYWQGLSENGIVLMELGEYAWSKRYGWVRDPFGVTWQLYLGEKRGEQKMVPTLMFLNENNGKAREAIEFYTGIFPNSQAGDILLYGAGVGNETHEVPHHIQHAWFTISGYTLFCMDSSFRHSFNFNEGISLVVMTEDQNETDRLWEKLTEGGSENPCGWLKDRFGLSWQVVPRRMVELINGDDIQKAQKAVNAMLKMKKIIIADLETAANS